MSYCNVSYCVPLQLIRIYHSVAVNSMWHHNVALYLTMSYQFIPRCPLKHTTLHRDIIHNVPLHISMDRSDKVSKMFQVSEECFKDSNYLRCDSNSWDVSYTAQARPTTFILQYEHQYLDIWWHTSLWQGVGIVNTKKLGVVTSPHEEYMVLHSAFMCLTKWPRKVSLQLHQIR